MGPFTAVEFFSGIGAFSASVESAGLPIKVVAAYDQSEDANRVFQLNFGWRPISRNLDSISSADIPECDIWWMSPPCKPYTVRGKQRDDEDARAASLLNLVNLIPVKRPSAIFLENVVAFGESRMYQRLLTILDEAGYAWNIIKLCPTDAGVPMKRPRLFLTAFQQHGRFGGCSFANQPRQDQKVQTLLADYVDVVPPVGAAMWLEASALSRYGEALNIVRTEDSDAILICFTSGYARSMKAAGSFLQSSADGERIRRFSPKEMLRLFGFFDTFVFPDDMNLETQWRLIGNSVDVRCIKFLLSQLDLAG